MIKPFPYLVGVGVLALSNLGSAYSPHREAGIRFSSAVTTPRPSPIASPVLAGEQYEPRKLAPEDKQRIVDHFLNKLVVAKISMPMTTAGISISWVPKTSKWTLQTNAGDLRRWGVGVRAGGKYSITKVVFEGDRVELWLNDGGTISSSDQMANSWNWSQSRLDQIKNNQEMASKKASADGSRIKIYVKDLPRAHPLLEAISTQAATVVDLSEGVTSANVPSSVQPAAETGVLFLTSEPVGADVFVDDAFVGQTPVKLPLKTGPHTIRVSSPAHQDWSREIQVITGAEVNLKASLLTRSQD